MVIATTGMTLAFALLVQEGRTSATELLFGTGKIAEATKRVITRVFDTWPSMPGKPVPRK